jgi:hypothetical protein
MEPRPLLGAYDVSSEDVSQAEVGSEHTVDAEQ